MEKIPKQKFHPNIILLGLASGLNDISSEMIIPILPLLITKVGGGGIALGLIGGLRDSISNIFKFFFGYLSDKKKKRIKFIFTGYLISGIFRFLLIYVNNWHMILALIGLERVGKSIRTAPRDALISQSIPDRMGRGFGVHRSMDTTGAILGSLLVFFLIWRLDYSLSTIIITSAFIGIASLIPLLWVKESSAQSSYEVYQLKLNTFSSKFKVFTGIASVFSLANISYMFFMLRVLDSSKNGFTTPLLLYIMYNIVYSLLAVPMGIISDMIGRWKIMILGYTTFAVATLGFALGGNLITFALSFMLYGAATAIIKVGHCSFISDVSKPTQRATALGIFDTTTGIITLIGGLIAGVLWEQITHSMIFFYATGIALISVSLLFIMKPYLQVEPQDT